MSATGFSLTNYLTAALPAGLTAEPYTIMGWGKVTGIANPNVLIAFNDSAADNNLNIAMANSGGRKGQVAERISSQDAVATTNLYVEGNWACVIGRVTGSTLKQATLDGDIAGSVSGALRSGTLANYNDRMTLGVVAYNVGPTVALPFDRGPMAQIAVWNVLLTDQELVDLAAGVNPADVRPANLVAHYPLSTDATPLVGPALTMVGTISFSNADDPPINPPAAGLTLTNVDGDNTVVPNQQNVRATGTALETATTFKIKTGTRSIDCTIAAQTPTTLDFHVPTGAALRAAGIKAGPCIFEALP